MEKFSALNIGFRLRYIYITCVSIIYVYLYQISTICSNSIRRIEG